MSYFQDVYWIGLERRQDRAWTFEHTEIVLGPNREMIRVPAMDGTRLRLVDDPVKRSESHLRGAVGCYLTHLSVLQRIAASKRDSLVIEDDTQLHDDFMERLQREVKSEWDLIMFARRGTWAYIVRWQTARWLASALQDRRYAIDCALMEFGDSGQIRLLVVDDMVTHLKDEFGSNITEDKPFKVETGSAEEAVVAAFFDSRETAKSFLDVGCGGGEKSVTRHMALEGWKGVYIEPDPYQWVRLHSSLANVSDLRFLCAAVASDQQLRSLMLSHDGKSTTDPEQFARKKQEVAFWSAVTTPSLTPRQIEQFGPFSFTSLNCSGLDEQIVKESGPLLEGTILLRIRNCDRTYLAAKHLGFSTTVLETEDHLLLSK